MAVFSAKNSVKSNLPSNSPNEGSRESLEEVLRRACDAVEFRLKTLGMAGGVFTGRSFESAMAWASRYCLYSHVESRVYHVVKSELCSIEDICLSPTIWSKPVIVNAFRCIIGYEQCGAAENNVG